MGTATITEWDALKTQAVSGGVSLTVDFDPQSLELTYNTSGSPSGNWNQTPSQQTGQSVSLAVTLLFDTSTSHGVSVQTRTDQLVLLTLPHTLGPKGGVRRVIQFHWGSFLFQGCVESMSQTIDFFSDTGVPLRSSVHLTIGQVGPPEQPSSPGSGAGGLGLSFGANVGIGAGASFGAGASAGASFGASASAGASVSAGVGIGTTPLTLSQDGDTVQGISARAGGSSTWKAVAVANNIDNPRLLPPGTVLSASAGAQLTASAG